MGICYSSSSSTSVNQTPPSTSQFTSVEVSQTTTTTTTTSNMTSSGSNVSGESEFSAASGGAGQMLPNPNLRVFTLSELKAATRNFRNDTVLGEGGFGKVYKGWLIDDRSKPASNGTVIAVKRLNSESLQGFQEWQSEVNFLGRLSHPNLVKLLGYGWEDKELLLVYEFMQKGSLENHLFGSKCRKKNAIDAPHRATCE